MAASSSSSLATFQQKKYDVFISFRGVDVRNGFLSHLHKALIGEGLDVFVDENLERGEDITSSLLQTIEQSYLSLVIFSENYAFSPWCLDELVKIKDCVRNMEQKVLPIFYGVDPTHVQELTESFGTAIVKHRIDFKDKVDNWCQALMETAELSGLVSQNTKSDSELIEEIVKHSLNKLDAMYPAPDSYNDELVGIDSRIKEVESLLCPDTVDVRFIGIGGMGGIGKTTLAKAVYDRIKHRFQSHCFFESIREKSETFTPDHLQGEILSEILGIKPNTAISNLLSPLNRKRLARKTVLIILDDVSELRQVELLIGSQVEYGPSSRIIITSRDKHLLKYGPRMLADIYEVEELDECESLMLFCIHSLKKTTPQQGYDMLSRRAVRYAQGLPLALKVLGSSLCGKSIEEWEDELDKLQNTSDDKIQKILRVSYDGLCENDKEILLDIACFFKGHFKSDVQSLIGTGSKIGISRLVDKCLISISDSYWLPLKMHDLIQQMAKDIICEEKQLGKRSRLWHHEDICYVLTKHKGTAAIQALSLDMSKIKDVKLSPKAFERLENLRFLKFHNNNRVHLPKGLKVLPNVLRFLQWDGFPSKCLPVSFCAKNLVELRMPNNKLKELWNDVQDLKNLKIIDLQGSEDLVRIPDLSTALNLEVLHLKFCPEIEELPEIPYYKGRELSLVACEKLRSLPDSICDLKHLERLFVWECSNLHGLPENFGNLQSLNTFDASLSGIKELPNSICNIKHLRSLDISSCRNLVRLPENLSNLASLQELKAYDTSIKELPDSICDLKHLQVLNISCCVNLVELPKNLGNLTSLEVLFVGESLRELPDSICDLRHLRLLGISGCVNLVELPKNLGSLASLEKLYAQGSGIKYLPQLPSPLMLDVRNRTPRKSTYSPSSLYLPELKNQEHKEFRFDNCLNLGEEELNKMLDHLQQIIPLTLSESREVHEGIEEFKLWVPRSEVPQKMKYQNKGGSLFITQLEQISSIGGFIFCVVLDPSLMEIPDGGGIVLRYVINGLRAIVLFEAERLTIQSKHIIFGFENLAIPRTKYIDTAQFHFQFHLDVVPYCGSPRLCNDAIIGCGVHPVYIFSDDFLDDDANYSDETEEGQW